METPDILNSKIKKIRLELPHYTFSHSSSGDSPHEFVGRERIRERIKKVIEDSPDEPGVYLIAGNRGVGKTSLISWIINKTSLKAKSDFTENFKYMLLLLFVVAGAQFCLQIFEIPKNHPVGLGITLLTIFGLFFSLLCYFNSYRSVNVKQNIFLKILYGITSGIKELSYLLNPHNPYRKTQYFLKITVIISFTQIVSLITKRIISPIIVLFCYFIFVLTYNFIFRYVRNKLQTKKVKNKYKKLPKENTSVVKQIIGLCLDPLWNYIKNHNRLYLRINFGHKLRDEKDILRLITSTLSREYIKYHRSFRRMLPRRIITFGLLFIFVYFFSPVIERQEFYKKLVKESDLYKASSQVIFEKPFLKDNKRLKNAFSIINKKPIIINKVVKTNTNNPKISKKDNFFLILDQIVFEITKVVKKAPQFFLCNYDKNELKEKNVLPINYLFWLSLLIMYLIFKLLFSCNWIMNLFVTNQIINKKLKKLNNDIVHSTERENTIKVNSGNTGPEIGTNVKKIRNVADAREIEKELHDILDDMQRIPIIFCRPNVVIVFDELDKVEPGDSGLEKDSSQTKASLFSIYATRERQTEILKILSNMKYFLSTARAKFIFIAGREMFDIHLADVSERNNYIGSIFNVVILVPSFLTDHHTGEEYLPQESSIASLPEEFVCRRLFPHDYPEKNYNLKSYRLYLLRMMIYEVAHNKKERRRIEQEIEEKKEKIINSLKEEEIKEILDEIYDGQIKQKIIKQKGKIKQTIKIKIPTVKESKIDEKIKSLNKKIDNVINCAEKAELEIINKDNEKADDIKEIITKKNREIKIKLKDLINEVRSEEIGKIIAVLQQFIIYLAHVSKGAPKKMIQLFESFIDIRIKRDDSRNTLLVQHYHSSRYFLSFNYYKQYTLGIVAYLITPIFYRLAESNIKEHSDKLMVSSLRFVDFLFKFHKHSFSWKHLDMSPEMLEVNRAPELKSVAVDLLDYLTQVHINKSNFSLSEYKFDGLIANEIFAMAKTDEVFSALFSFSLDEMLPLKKHFQDLLEKKENEYEKKKRASEYIDAISSLQEVLGDLHYYDDELEEAETYYKSAIQALGRIKEKNEEKSMTLEQLYIYAGNMLRLGLIYEKRNQYDRAYLTYGELCERIIQERNTNKDYMSFKRMTYEGLKMLYLPFIARLQIIEQSHIGGINHNHLKKLNQDFNLLTFIIHNEEAKILEAEFYSRVADILYYKNSDLEDFNCNNDKKNSSCTACDYYFKALSILLNKIELYTPYQDNIKKLLCESVAQLKDNYNMKFCTVLARIFSDWGNVFFSCDTKNEKNGCGCYICNGMDCNTKTKKSNNNILENCIKYINSEKENPPSLVIDQLETKKDIAFAMYSISLEAYCKTNLYKRAAYQIYKMLYLFKQYEIYNEENIRILSRKAIHYLWYANDDLNVLELTKRKKDFSKNIEETIPLKNLLVNTEITRIRILVKELKLKLNFDNETIKEYYDLRITSPYRINYSIVGRIYRLHLKTNVNYKAYQKLLEKVGIKEKQINKDFILKKYNYDKIVKNESCNETVKDIFGKYFDIKNIEDVTGEKKRDILENLIADSIYCLTDIAQLSETMEETYLFPHSFLGSIHEHLSFWIRQYKAYNIYKEKNSQIDKLLDQYLGEEWKEQLSGYRENQRALSHYYKCLEMHKEGKAYHNMIDNIYYLKDDFNDRSDHFNIAEERHLIVNGKIDDKINKIKDIYKESKLYDIDNYFNTVV